MSIVRSEQATGATLVDLIDRVLDKGVVINADIAISVGGVELLDIKLRAAIASFETAARYGLEMPSGTNLELPVWDHAKPTREACPGCGKPVVLEELLNHGCPWCGWQSARARGGNGKLLQAPRED
jgi:predicted RNA-binding Zn-ribbon protein involved in translation (DUF1610 family)